MSIDNPYALKQQDSAWDMLILNGAKFPGIVTNVTETIAVEINSYESNYLTGPAVFRAIATSYTTPTAQKPKEFEFSILIFKEEDAKFYLDLANSLSSGIKFSIKHPKTQMWGVNKVYISNVSSGQPSLVNGWEINITFIQAIDAPKPVLFDVELLKATRVLGQITITAGAKKAAKKPAGLAGVR